MRAVHTYSLLTLQSVEKKQKKETITMDIALFNVKKYDVEKAYNGEEITVTGEVLAVGRDNFISESMMKAEIYDNIESTLTEEQLEIVSSIRHLYEKKE